MLNNNANQAKVNISKWKQVKVRNTIYNPVTPLDSSVHPCVYLSVDGQPKYWETINFHTIITGSGELVLCNLKINNMSTKTCIRTPATTYE